MATAAPSAIAIPKTGWKPLKDTSCQVMCPECYVNTTPRTRDGKVQYGCPQCGLTFGLEYET